MASQHNVQEIKQLIKNAVRAILNPDWQMTNRSYTTVQMNFNLSYISDDMFKVAVGRKEESGSTRSISNFNAISNRFRYSFTTVQPGWKTDKLASQTAYMSDFRPFCHKNGSEPFSNWVGNLSYQKPTDYVIQNKIWPEYKSHHPYYVFKHSEDFPEVYLEKLKRKDSAKYQSATHESKEPSTTKGSQNDLKNQPKSSAELLGRVTIGRLEPSGSSLNISGHVQSQDMPLD
ncbi:unnamed protein product, partial [Schistosoma margrebowiei]